MIELLNAAIKALQNPQTLESDSRHWRNVIQRNILYLSEEQMQKVKVLLPLKHENPVAR